MSERIPPQKLVPVVGVFSEIIVPTIAQKAQYLEHVALGRSLHGAAADLGLPYMSVVRERRADEAFDNDLQIAIAARAGAWLEIAIEQCTVGVDEVITYQGHVSYEYPNGYELDASGRPKTGTVRVPVTVKKLVTNNPMLLKLLAVAFPESFKDRSEVDVNNRSRGAAPESVPDRITSDGDRDKLIALLDKRARSRMTVIDVDPDGDLL